MARPTKRTATTEERILEAIRLGAPYVLAAQAGGISYETLRTWLKAGEEGDPRFVAFSAAVRAAEIERLNESLSLIKQSKDWRAHMEFMSRRWPEHFSPHTKTELTGKDGGPVEFADVREKLLHRLSAFAPTEPAEGVSEQSE